MPIKEATKEDISAMNKRLHDAKVDLQIDLAIRMVNRHRKEDKGNPREEVFRFA